jgi:exonuclease SbcD
VQELLPNALEVRIDPDMVPDKKAQTAQRAGRSPRQLFGDYLDSRGITEDGVRELFDELYDEVSTQS